MVDITKPQTVLVFGAGGQVGQELLRTPWASGLQVVGLPQEESDVTDEGAVAAAFAKYRPALVVNASAYTAVDKAESEVDPAYAVNRDGPAHLARACAAAGASLIHISTDYVYDGDSKTDPWREDDATGPQGVYAASKLAGDNAVQEILPNEHVILRTAWVFGALGNNFVKTMLRLARERDELRVVADQRGCPTPAAAIAETIAAIAKVRLMSGAWTSGVFHYAGAPAVTWRDFAETIVARAATRIGRQPPVHGIATTDYPTPAKRPANSVLDTTRIAQAYGVPPADWRRGLDLMLDEILGETAVNNGPDAGAKA